MDDVFAREESVSQSGDLARMLSATDTYHPRGNASSAKIFSCRIHSSTRL